MVEGRRLRRPCDASSKVTDHFSLRSPHAGWTRPLLSRSSNRQVSPFLFISLLKVVDSPFVSCWRACPVQSGALTIMASVLADPFTHENEFLFPVLARYSPKVVNMHLAGHWRACPFFRFLLIAVFCSFTDPFADLCAPTGVVFHFVFPSSLASLLLVRVS